MFKSEKSEKTLEFQNSIPSPTFAAPPPSYSSINGTIPQPNNAPPSNTAHQLHVYYQGWRQNRINILASDKTTPLYHADISGFGQKMAFFTASGEQIASVKLPCGFKRRINTVIRGREEEVRIKGMWKPTYEYSSGAMGSQGGQLAWVPAKGWTRSCKSDCQLEVVGTGEVLARYEGSGWSFKKAGKIEIVGLSGQQGMGGENGMSTDQMLIDEIVVMSVAIAHYKAQQAAASSAAASSSSSSA